MRIQYSTLSLTIILLYITSAAYSQSTWSQFSSIRNIEEKDDKVLAKLITENYESTEDKAKAIYYWIGHNIKYDDTLSKRFKRSQKKRKKRKISLKKIAKAEAKDIKRVLKTKKGASRHFALLFNRLCSNVNIESKYLTGISKHDFTSIKDGGEAHAWNAIQLNDEWKMVDVMLGSVQLKEEDNFTPLFDTIYFDTPNHYFVMNHYPRRRSWQFSDYLVTRREYNKFPMIGSSYINYGITNIEPLNNTIKSKAGEKIAITFTTKKQIKSQIFCIDLNNNETTPILVAIRGKEVTLEIDTEGLDSGAYQFVLDNKLLFAYRFKIN